MRKGGSFLDGARLTAIFNSRYLILRAARAGSHPALLRAPFREVYRDASSVLYHID